MPESKSEPLTGGQGFPADNPDGTPGLIGPDDYTKQYRINRILQNNQTVLAGNIADMQRAGAEAATTGENPPGVAAPPGVDPKSDSVLTPAQAEAARGEFTRETERTGLLEAPPAPVPAENTSPDPVDPTSTSPTVEAKSKSAGTANITTTKK